MKGSPDVKELRAERQQRRVEERGLPAKHQCHDTIEALEETSYEAAFGGRPEWMRMRATDERALVWRHSHRDIAIGI